MAGSGPYMKPIIRIGTPLRSIFKNGGMKGMGSSMYIRMVEMAAKTPISVTIRVLDRRGSWLFCGSVLVFVIEYIPFSMPAAAGKFDREGLSVLGKGIKKSSRKEFQEENVQNTRRFFIPDFTVGLGFSPSLPVPVGENRAADLWLTAHHRQ